MLDLRSGRRTDTPIGDDGVGSLVLGAGRRVAWITCPVRYTLGGRPAVYSVSRFYSQPGRNAQVLAGGPGCTDTPRRLDRGVAVVPGSLTLRGDALRWRRAGRVRSARLR